MIQFSKYQGTGNDFILVDNRLGTLQPQSKEIRHWCDRKFGVGADGLILLEDSRDHDFKMVYFNADGKESSMCGNGGRCIAKIARSLNVCDDHGVFEAIDGLHPFEIDSHGVVRLKMKDVNAIENDGSATIMDTGSPHYTVFTEDLMELDILNEAGKIRYGQRFKEEGINVNFIEVTDGKYYMRTYERGVEDETLSCGTGTVAVALTIAAVYNVSGPFEIITPGGKLTVHFKRIDEGFSDIWLEGSAEKVFDGVIQT